MTDFYSFTSTAADAAGNISSASTALSLTIDTDGRTARPCHVHHLILPMFFWPFRGPLGILKRHGGSQQHRLKIFDSASGALVGTALATGDGRVELSLIALSDHLPGRTIHLDGG